VGWGYPERVEVNDMGTDERCPKVDETKGQDQTTSTNMKPKPLLLTFVNMYAIINKHEHLFRYDDVLFS
ncbi:MAG: hypothetical protein QW399_03765, partial [Sulfolobales archaeon]